MIHPDAELRLISAGIGHGVVATRPIPVGTITWVLDDLDQVIGQARMGALAPALQAAIDTYAYVDATGARILCWDHGRFGNHSCSPSTVAPGYGFDLAVRDIAAGEELTNDYATLNLDRPFTCLCATPACRREIRPADFADGVDRFDALVAAAFPRLRSVPQPLWDLVREQDAVLAALAGQEPIASCRVHLLEPGRAGSAGETR